jgi:predicted metallo-beta-lactamase superfamily hydrolase
MSCAGLRWSLLEVKVKILGADSFGARSMATIVCAGGVKIAIDPGVSFAPRRYGLPPHEIELRRVEEIHDRIVRELEDADIIVITHYHYDHYLYKPEDLEVYTGKWLIVKDPKHNINVSQRLRAHRLLVKNGVGEKAWRVDILDGQQYTIDDGLRIEGSPPVPHGPEGSKLGYVSMVMVECCGLRFVHASDVQGPMSRKALDIILSWRPDILFISGPPTYFEGVKMPEEHVRRGLDNLKLLAMKLDDAIIIADHHFARDLNYPILLSELFNGCRAKVISAAEFMGVKFEPLEALRKKLWGKDNGEEAADSDRES